MAGMEKGEKGEYGRQLFRSVISSIVRIPRLHRICSKPKSSS